MTFMGWGPLSAMSINKPDVVVGRLFTTDVNFGRNSHE